MKKKKRSVVDMIEDLKLLDFINPEDIPGIELYMDQVTTFMDEHLSGNRRNEDDKIMTKTMINNYTKNDLLPPPNKKRYSKEHIILLIYIYYLKNLLSISDIQTFLQTMIDRYYDSGSDKGVDDIYKNFYEFQKEHFGEVTDSINQISANAAELHSPDEDAYLFRTTLISMLSFDVYIKKKFIENLIDEMREDQIAAAAAKQRAAERAKANEKAKAEKAKAAKKAKND